MESIKKKIQAVFFSKLFFVQFSAFENRDEHVSPLYRLLPELYRQHNQVH